MERSREPQNDFYDWHQVPRARAAYDEGEAREEACPLCGELFVDGPPLIAHVEDCISTYESKQAAKQAAEAKEKERGRERLTESENERLLFKLLDEERQARESGREKVEEKKVNPIVDEKGLGEKSDEKGLDEKGGDRPSNNGHNNYNGERNDKKGGWGHNNPSQYFDEGRRKEEEENERLLEKFLQEEREREAKDAREREATASSADFECAICHKTFPFGHENAMFLDECSHYYCRPCLKGFVLPLVSAKQLSALKCQVPDCKRPLNPPDVQQCLPKADYERYLDATFASAVESSNQFIACPNQKCKNIIERIAAAERSNLTKSAEISYWKEQYRFRCSACQTEFCSNCHESPYHEGFTCAEFKELKDKKKCRFCHAPVSSPDKDVCNSRECQERRIAVCEKKLACGHMCNGVKGEKECLPCLNEECSARSKLMQHADDFCNICWVESLDSAPSIQLKCGHVFHFQCVRKQLEGKWNSAHIVFNFMECPLCMSPIEHPLLQNTLDPLLAIRKDIQDKAIQRLKFLNLESAKEVEKDVGGPFYKKPLAYALKRFCYYQCFKCKKPYFGGERSCNAEQRAEEYDPKELVCAPCSGAGKGVECSLHKNDFMFCWGNTHFCDPCHRNHATVTKLPKEKLPPCSCKIPHPPNGEEFCIGCSLCQLEPKDF